MFKKISLIIWGIMLSFALEAKDNILVYNGPGAGPISVQSAVDTIKLVVGDKYNVITAGPDVLIRQDWQQNTALLVMPGGADRPYLSKLKGQGNDNIKTFVKNGGKYLGICAGAYYASDRLEFGKGEPDLEVIGERELKFFPGLISGPTYAGFDHRDLNIHAGARAAKLSWQAAQPFAKNTELRIFYNGGGSFIEPEKYSNVKVLARFYPEVVGDTNYPAAIVECAVGKGMAILSSPHFEWSAKDLDVKSSNLLAIKPYIEAAEEQRVMLARYLLERLGV